MLFHHLLAPGSGVDIEQLVCSLHESVDVAKLHEAWQRVVRRHAVLRTGFRWQGLETPLQNVYGEVALPFEFTDWRGLSSDEQELRLTTFLRTDRARGFRMTDAPLLRLSLFQRDAVRFELIWTFHHALLDGRSFPLVLREVFAFYEASLRGEDIDPPLPRPYRDYIDWLRGHDFGTAESFWRSQLAGIQAATPLVVDHAAQEVGGGPRRGEQTGFLSPTTTSQLRALADEHQLTLNVFVLGAWALLLHRYSGAEDVVFGATRACRRSAWRSSPWD
jgi:hypothetical protein